MTRTVCYTRVSTDKQTTENQETKLREMYPTAEFIEECASGVRDRPVLRKLLESLNAGDRLIITALCRLGRKTLDVLGNIELLNSRGVILISLREGVDYSTITGKLVTQILVSIYELEVNLISDRTRLALASRKALGIHCGRPRKQDSLIPQIIEMREQGKSFKEISKTLSIPASTANNLFKHHKKS